MACEQTLLVCVGVTRLRAERVARRVCKHVDPAVCASQPSPQAFARPATLHLRVQMRLVSKDHLLTQAVHCIRRSSIRRELGDQRVVVGGHGAAGAPSFASMGAAVIAVAPSDAPIRASGEPGLSGLAARAEDNSAPAETPRPAAVVGVAAPVGQL